MLLIVSIWGQPGGRGHNEEIITVSHLWAECPSPADSMTGRRQYEGPREEQVLMAWGRVVVAA